MRIVFLHGLQSSPDSCKRRLLENHGHEVYAPRLDPDDWDSSVLCAKNIIKTVEPDVVIGSSRGGAVAIAARPNCPTVLVAPAWRKYCPWGTISATTQIIHSQADEVVDFDESVALSHAFGADLVEAGYDHRVNDADATTALLRAIDKIA